MSEAEVVEVLDQIAKDSLRTGKLSLGRLATVQAMVDLGRGWHKYTEVARQLQRYIVTGGIYTFQLAGKYPSVFQQSEDHLVRINPDAFDLVAKNVKRKMKEVKATARKGSEK